MADWGPTEGAVHSSREARGSLVFTGVCVVVVGGAETFIFSSETGSVSSNVLVSTIPYLPRTILSRGISLGSLDVLICQSLLGTLSYSSATLCSHLEQQFSNCGS